MLSTLRIGHIGVIDDALLEFGPGFTALTGETGAGKTMIVTGLTMLLGGRLDRGRTGTASTVDGTLRLQGHTELISALDELGAEDEDGEVLVVRRVTRDGRSRAQIGGVPIPIGTLARLVGSAVTVHGQSDQQRLRDADPQREALDAFAGDAVTTPRETYRGHWRRHREIAARRQELEALMQERDRRGAVLTDALDRLEQADPQPGEDDALRSELDRLANAVDLRTAADGAGLALIGDDAPSAVALLDHALDAVRTAAGTDPTLAPLAERLDSARIELSDVAAELSRYAEDVEASPGRLDEANQRLHDLTTLVRDLGPLFAAPGQEITRVSDLLETSARAAATVTAYEGAEEELAGLVREQEELSDLLDAAATALTTARREAATSLARAVEEELRHLEMPGASLRVDVTATAPRETGRDAVAILLAPHPGAEHLPVDSAASGGELSRVMLALEVALGARRTDRDAAAPVFVFDEIDAGIGGRAALAVGQRLARLAEHAQVIVVTHLPQVAAHATTHLQIVKDAEAGRTTSTVRALDRPDRITELARMLAGDSASDVARAHAEELLAEAGGVPRGKGAR